MVERSALESNLATMSEALPGSRLRPHVKAHKCTALARRQAANGHRGFTCATIREVEGLARAGLGDDLLLANEVLDASRLGSLDARVTVAVDSAETIDAAVRGGVREVLIDVNVGLPRCGCPPDEAGRLADAARARRDVAQRRLLDAQRAEQDALAQSARDEATLTAAQAEVKSAEIALQGVRREAQAGQRTTIDVLNSQQDLTAARSRQILAQRDRVIASYTLLSAVGRLDVRTLGLNTPDYLPDVHYHQVRDAWHGVRTPSGR